MEVNLLVKRLKRVRKRLQLKKLAQRLILSGVIVLSLAMIGLSSLSLGVVRQNKRWEQRINQTKSRITALNEVESKQVYLLSKLSSFEKLLGLQAKHQAVAETVFSLIPDGTSLKGFDVNETGELILSGSVPDWPTLHQLLAKVRRPPAGALTITQATVSRISFGSTGEINFDLSLRLSQGRL